MLLNQFLPECSQELNQKKNQTNLFENQKNIDFFRVGNKGDTGLNFSFQELKYDEQIKKELSCQTLQEIPVDSMIRTKKIVQNFLHVLKLRSISRNEMRFLNYESFLVLGDLALYYFNKNEQISRLHNIYLQFHKFMKKIPLLQQADTFVLVWDAFQLIFTYIMLFVYSIFVFFAQEVPENIYLSTLLFISYLIFSVDILINFNITYLYKDEIIVQRKKIAYQYLFSHFPFDFLCILSLMLHYFFSFPLTYNPLHSRFTYIRSFCVFFKAVCLQKKHRRLESEIILKNSQKHILKLITCIIFIVTVAHIGAIGWYIIGLYQQNFYQSDTNWLQQANLIEKQWITKYLYSLYWAVTTMTTVGYGDISGSNQMEVLYISICMILFSCVFAYSINNMGLILQEIERNDKELNHNLSTIQRYLNRKKVTNQLKGRIKSYLNFLYEETKNVDQESEKEVLNKLSNNLNKELRLEINKKILNNCNIFSNNFSQNTLTKVIFIMEEIFVFPNENIFLEDDFEQNPNIYFLETGMVEIFHSQVSYNQKKERKIVIKTLNGNSFFGEISFFTGFGRCASARSLNLSTLYRIPRNQFIEILKENKEDFERFKMIQEQVMVQKDLNSLNIKCYLCQQKGHLAMFCPKTHCKFDKQFVSLKYNFSAFQERQNAFNYKLKQNKRKKQKSLLLLKKTMLILAKRPILKLQNSQLSQESSEEYSYSQYTSSSSSSSSNNTSQSQEVKQTSNNEILGDSKKNINGSFIDENGSSYQESLEKHVEQKIDYIRSYQYSTISSIQQTMDYLVQEFDKGTIFKKFFPQNNYDKVLSGLKSKQLLKLNTKYKTLKERRKGVKLFNTKLIFSKTFIAQQIQYNKIYMPFYPKFLSYGVPQQQGNTFPKRHTQK